MIRGVFYFSFKIVSISKALQSPLYLWWFYYQILGKLLEVSKLISYVFHKSLNRLRILRRSDRERSHDVKIAQLCNDPREDLVNGWRLCMILVCYEHAEGFSHSFPNRLSQTSLYGRHSRSLVVHAKCERTQTTFCVPVHYVHDRSWHPIFIYSDGMIKQHNLRIFGHYFLHLHRLD